MNEDQTNRDPVGPVPLPGGSVPVGPVPSPGGSVPVGPMPPPGVPVAVPSQVDPPPQRLRRLHRVWPDRDGNISYLLTVCVDGRDRILDNEPTFQRLVEFLLDSPQRYHWFGRRFVVMPDHIHVIARMGHDAVRLGEWLKALKSVVGGLKRRGGPEKPGRPVRAPGLQDAPPSSVVGRVPPHGVVPVVGPVPPPGVPMSPPDTHQFTRISRKWRWQIGYHDHKLRTPESESRKWEYVCLNPVRYHLVKRPEEWPFGGEIFHFESGGPQLVRGTPRLLETGMLIEKTQ